MSSTGRSPTGISGLGSTAVYGRSRVPSPPASTTALVGIASSSPIVRVAVIVPCFNCDGLVLEAVASLQEPVELVVVDDASTDAATQEALATLELQGVKVIRQTRNEGAAAARMTGLAATRAPYIFPLDADDLALPGRLARAADLLDAHPEAAACVGDYEEFGTDAIVRAVPETLDPYRIAFTNEYAI